MSVTGSNQMNGKHHGTIKCVWECAVYTAQVENFLTFSSCMIGLCLIVYEYYLFPTQGRKRFWELRAWSQAWVEFHLEPNFLLRESGFQAQRKINQKNSYTSQ